MSPPDTWFCFMMRGHHWELGRGPEQRAEAAPCPGVRKATSGPTPKIREGAHVPDRGLVRLQLLLSSGEILSQPI